MGEGKVGRRRKHQTLKGSGAADRGIADQNERRLEGGK
jgi:hypothetical protein